MSGSRRGTLQAPTTSKPDPGGTTGPSRTTGTRSQSTSRGNAASAAGADGQRIEGCSCRAGRLLFQKDQRRQIRVEKTFRQAIAHGTELLSQSHQWLLLLTTPGMAEGLSWLSEAETVSLLGQIQTVRDTLEKAEEVVLHGRAPDAVSPEEGGEVTNGDDDFKSPKNMGYG